MKYAGSGHGFVVRDAVIAFHSRVSWSFAGQKRRYWETVKDFSAVTFLLISIITDSPLSLEGGFLLR